VCDKVVWILKGAETQRTVLGVLVINIEECPQWTSPSRASVLDNFIQKDRWEQAAGVSRERYPFGSINIGGNAWVGHVKVDICLFQTPWGTNDRDPPQVRFRSLIMNNC
jgi:hypothetical protein